MARSIEYFNGYRAGHADGYAGIEPTCLDLAPEDFVQGYVRGYRAGHATREYADTHNREASHV